MGAYAPVRLSPTNDLTAAAVDPATLVPQSCAVVTLLVPAVRQLNDGVVDGDRQRHPLAVAGPGGRGRLGVARTLIVGRRGGGADSGGGEKAALTHR